MEYETKIFFCDEVGYRTEYPLILEDVLPSTEHPNLSQKSLLLQQQRNEEYIKNLKNTLKREKKDMEHNVRNAEFAKERLSRECDRLQEKVDKDAKQISSMQKQLDEAKDVLNAEDLNILKLVICLLALFWFYTKYF